MFDCTRILDNLRVQCKLPIRLDTKAYRYWRPSWYHMYRGERASRFKAVGGGRLKE